MKVRSYVYICTHNFAGMVKLVDMPDLGSGAARRVGSSPITRTKKASRFEKLFFWISIKYLFEFNHQDFIFETLYVFPSPVASTTLLMFSVFKMVLSKEIVADFFSKSIVAF